MLSETTKWGERAQQSYAAQVPVFKPSCYAKALSLATKLQMKAGQIIHTQTNLQIQGEVQPIENVFLLRQLEMIHELGGSRYL